MKDYLKLDSYVLLSLVNTRLRNYYANLDDLTEDLNINQEELINKLESIEYYYSKELNQFIAMD